MHHLFFNLQLNEEISLSDLDLFQRITIKLLTRFIIDVASLAILIQTLYLKQYQKRSLIFTYYVFNLIIFFIAYLLNKVDLSLGAAFGLFAVFGMLRFKTDELSIKDMSYLFLSIALGVVNAIAKIKGANDAFDYLFLLLIDALILIACFWLEKKYGVSKEKQLVIPYDKIEWISESNHPKIMDDLKIRTGLNVFKIEILKVDLSKPVVSLKVFYTD